MLIFQGVPQKMSRNSPFPSDQYPVSMWNFSDILGNRSTTGNPWGFHLTWWLVRVQLKKFEVARKGRNPFQEGLFWIHPSTYEMFSREISIYFFWHCYWVGGRSKIYCMTSCKSHTKDTVTLSIHQVSFLGLCKMKTQQDANTTQTHTHTHTKKGNAETHKLR